MTGNNLKEIRLKLGLTQTEMAKMLGYRYYSEIWRLESLKDKKLPTGAIARIKAAGLVNKKSTRKTV